MVVEGRQFTRSAIPGPTVARLPVYHRALRALSERHEPNVSSSDLSHVVGVNAATLRRDLSRLGSVGLRGTGYDVEHLLRRVEGALALNQEWPVIIVGVGNLGRALARSQGFRTGDFKVVALVDVNPKVVGTTIDGIEVGGLAEVAAVVQRENIKIGVITTPASAAQDVATRLADAGVSAILNFAPAVVALAPTVKVRQVDLSAELEVLAFYGAQD